MHWVLQNNLFDERGFDDLLQILERAGIPHSIHKVIPFIGELTPPAEPASKNVICLGSYSMRHTAVKEGWYPGVFDLEPMDFTVQFQHWGDHMLNADSRVCKFKELPEILSNDQIQMLKLGALGGFDDWNYDIFMRPIHDSKVFAGRVFKRNEILEWVKKVVVLNEDDGSSMSGETLVQVCAPKKVYAEYRLWVVKGQIVTASMYKRGDRVFYSSEVDQCYFDYVNDRIAEWQPLDAFVIDVCSIPGTLTDQFKIVEINTINSAGFYAADMSKLVAAFEEHYNEASV